jgi:NAD(P)-dependent dehydrogenase (short-subunit alcohol dehydrogenase family)
MTTHRFSSHSTGDDVVAGMDLSGRCVLVAGANSGIGFETARALASAGARVLLAGRNTSALQSAISQITKRHPKAQLETLALDLAAFGSVRRCAAELPTERLAALVRPFTKTLAQGAATSVYCAVAPELADVGGRYFVDCREKSTSRGAQDDSLARRLWDLSAERVGAAAEAA